MGHRIGEPRSATSLGTAAARCFSGEPFSGEQSGEHLEAEAPDSPAVAVELATKDIEGPIRLAGAHRLASDGAGEEVRELEPAAVGLLVGEGHLERQAFPAVVRACTDPVELLGKLVILSFPPALEDQVGLPAALSLGLEEAGDALQPEGEGDMVGI